MQVVSRGVQVRNHYPERTLKFLPDILLDSPARSSQPITCFLVFWRNDQESTSRRPQDIQAAQAQLLDYVIRQRFDQQGDEEGSTAHSPRHTSPKLRSVKRRITDK